ncbi:MAG TPA: hypothetical protein VMH91_01815 [Candidatus Paceibacterota bacterium]|nr:hypothetical protein [Candidatus Paceibacterota bacterium]
MMDFISSHKLMSLVVLALLVGAAWWEFTASSSSPILSTTGAAGNNQQENQIVSTLLQLQAVTLSGTILTDPGFMSLQDYTTQIISEPLGRPNPFAPVSPGTSGVPSTQPVNPNLFAPAKH